MTTYTDAYNYATQLNWAVFPVHSISNGKCTCGNPNCTSPGKHPRTIHGISDATTDPKQIDTWWRQWPEANIGVATGAVSGIWVLDIDPRHGGDESLDLLEQSHGKLPATVESITGGGGKHLFFGYPATGAVKSRTNHPGAGLDIRGDGGFVVLPPSSHISGQTYMWEASSAPIVNPVNDAPQWLIGLIMAKATKNAPQQPQQKYATAGGRNTLLTRKAGQLRRMGLDQTELEAVLALLNQTHCVPPLPDAEVKKIAGSVGRYAPPHVPTDDELADVWLKDYPDTAHGMGDFRRYANGCWPVVPRERVELEILTVMEHAKRDGYKPTSWKLRSIMEIARIKCGVENELWNADRDLIACKNGTLHIPTMTLIKHDKDHYLTSGVAYDYDPAAAADTWAYYCRTILNETESFLQEYAGYALTTDTQYEIAIWLYGPSGSGKSTFIEGMQATLGARAGILGLKDLEKSRFSLTDLPDKTLLVSTEQPNLYMQTTDIVNALISGEPVMVDRKFRDPVIVLSHAKICWAMNELPRVNDGSNGLFRRVKVIEFTELPEGVRAPSIKATIKTEGSGILNWALAGLARLRARGGFDIPQCVIEATDLFKMTNDIPFLFAGEMLETGPNYSISGSGLYKAYRDWCDENGHKAQSSTSVAMDWRRLGYKRKRTSHGVLWEGVRLK